MPRALPLSFVGSTYVFGKNNKGKACGHFFFQLQFSLSVIDEFIHAGLPWMLSLW